VAEDQRRTATRIAPVIGVHVRPADADRIDAEDDVAVVSRGIGLVAVRDLVGFV
jgi:hypothetical protein